MTDGDFSKVTDNSTINFINNEDAKSCISLPNQNQGDSILIQVTASTEKTSFNRPEPATGRVL